MTRQPLDEPIRPHGFIRFLIILGLCATARFFIGEIKWSFYWFVLLYFPTMNWCVYWAMGTVRLIANKLRGYDWIRIAKLRKFYKWYINLPGGLVLSEFIFQCYILSR